MVETVHSPTAPFRLIAWWLLLDGHSDTVFEVNKQLAKSACQLNRRKAIDGKTEVYIMNAVLMPEIVHKTAANIMLDNQRRVHYSK